MDKMTITWHSKVFEGFNNNNPLFGYVVQDNGAYVVDRSYDFEDEESMWNSINRVVNLNPSYTVNI